MISSFVAPCGSARTRGHVRSGGLGELGRMVQGGRIARQEARRRNWDCRIAEDPENKSCGRHRNAKGTGRGRHATIVRAASLTVFIVARHGERVPLVAMRSGFGNVGVASHRVRLAHASDVRMHGAEEGQRKRDENRKHEGGETPGRHRRSGYPLRVYRVVSQPAGPSHVLKYAG